MNIFLHLTLWMAAALTQLVLAGEFQQDLALNEGLAALRSGIRAFQTAERLGPTPGHTLDSFRARFSAGRRPETSELRPGDPWTCYSIVNKDGTAQRLVDEVTFHEFDGKVLSTGSVPHDGTLEYGGSEGSMSSAFRWGKRQEFWLVPAYRVEADGVLVREVGILWLDLPLGNPSGFARTETLGVPRVHYGRVTGLRVDGTVYSYGICAPRGSR